MKHLFLQLMCLVFAFSLLLVLHLVKVPFFLVLVFRSIVLLVPILCFPLLGVVS